mgnify:CR=1 FL=1
MASRAQSPNGVGWYTSGVAHVEIHFPEDKVCCANCVPFCRFEEAFKRYSCRATGEQLLCPFATIGAMCPIKFKEENN